MNRWSVDPDVEDALRGLLAAGVSPARAIRTLAGDDGYRGRLPSLRTVQRIAREVRPATGQRWSFATADPDDARLVLEVVGELQAIGSLSVETADWIVRVGRAAPELDARERFVWAVRYQTAAASSRDTTAVDIRFGRELVSRRASPSSS